MWMHIILGMSIPVKVKGHFKSIQVKIRVNLAWTLYFECVPTLVQYNDPCCFQFEVKDKLRSIEIKAIKPMRELQRLSITLGKTKTAKNYVETAIRSSLSKLSTFKNATWNHWKFQFLFCLDTKDMRITCISQFNRNFKLINIVEQLYESFFTIL